VNDDYNEMMMKMQSGGQNAMPGPPGMHGMQMDPGMIMDMMRNGNPLDMWT